MHAYSLLVHMLYELHTVHTLVQHINFDNATGSPLASTDPELALLAPGASGAQ